MSSRSNSARAAKIPKTSLPDGGAGVDGRPLPGEDLEPHTASGEVVDGVDQVVQVPAESVELPDDEGVAVPEGLEAGAESGAVIGAARGKVLIELGGVYSSTAP